MKYVILRCEDEARSSDQTVALLEGAKTAHLQHLAQAGAAGTLSRRVPQGPMDRFGMHRALFGLKRQYPGAQAAQCYAASLNVDLAPGETAWCCELATQQDGRIIDPCAGNITTKESRILIQAIDEELGSDTRRWEVGEGSHHLLIVRDPALGLDGIKAVPSPELLIGQVWERHLPKGPLGTSLRSLVAQGSGTLERHPVNRVRVDLGENPANMPWFWGAAEAGARGTFTERTRLTGAMVSDSFLLRGFARCLGLGWTEGPSSLEEPLVHHLMGTVTALLNRHDLVYVQLRITSSDPVERLCAMERIDQLLLKPLTERLPDFGPWRLAVVIDDRRSLATPFISLGTGLPQQPLATLAAQGFTESRLAFEEGQEFFSWFTQRDPTAAT